APVLVPGLNRAHKRCGWVQSEQGQEHPVSHAPQTPGAPGKRGNRTVKGKQLSDRIGNIDDRLTEEAEHMQNYGKHRRQKIARNFAAAAAALAVMVGGGFGLGATVFAQEIEVQVEVPVEPESVT